MNITLRQYFNLVCRNWRNVFHMSCCILTLIKDNKIQRIKNVAFNNDFLATTPKAQSMKEKLIH